MAFFQKLPSSAEEGTAEQSEAGVVLVHKFNLVTSTTPALRATPLFRLRPIGLALRAQLRRGVSSIRYCVAFGALLSCGTLLTFAFAADADHGKELFSACAACHTEKPDASGPRLKGVVGRKSAALEDFRYSNAMKRADLTWDEATLKEYLRDPQAKVKGTRMPFSGFSSPSDVDDIVAYLVTLK